ncbi:MAG: citrate synthase [Clostridia bacterium]|nr:citrate synthase [Clostridia bacterium]
MQVYSKNYKSDHDENIEREFQSMLDDAREAYVIPKKAFESYRVKRGLREVDGSSITAGVTRIGNVHGYVMNEGEKCADDGRLEYRGYEISTLVNSFVEEDRFGFEECAFLLFFGHLPSKTELEEFNDILAAYRRLPPRFTEDIIMKAPSRSIMNKMSSAVLALYAYDDNPDDNSLENMLHQSMELVARLPVIAAQSYAVYKNAFFDRSLNIHNPKDDLSTAQNVLRVMRSDKSYTAEEARLLDVCLAVHAEHGGGNCSTFTCRVLSSAGTDTYSAISAAIGALKGPRHGGANIKVQEMFDDMKASIGDITNEQKVKDHIVKLLRGEAYDGSGLVYGMGHAIYTKSDPRAVMLKKYARDLAAQKGYGDDFALLEMIEKYTPELFYECRGVEKDMCANVDLYSGLVYRMLDIPVEMYTPLFAIARVAGWCAHRMEEYCTSNKIIRPGYKCISRPKPYLSLDKREQ